jgi:hypothetical protein
MRTSLLLLVSVAFAPSFAMHACGHMGGSYDEAALECVTDDDCGLMPSEITCCGECEPVPPFEAVPRTAIDARLLELETYCAERTIECVPPSCAAAPPGCTARATCDRGTCRAITSGCERRVAERS